MVNEKNGSATGVSSILGNRSKFSGTEADELDMRTMGKTQQLNRNFRFISILAFSSTAMSTWEFTLASSFFGILNGGLAGLVWGYFIAWMGYLLVFASIAEMASMAPTSGGQYHWVSEFAPPSYQRFLSYLVGWLSTLGWQCGLASLAFIDGTVIQGLIILNNPTYIYERWHGTLLVIAILSFCIIFNTLLAHRLPMIEAGVLVIHFLGFLGIVSTLWALAHRNSAEIVFTQFTNLGGWNSTGLSFLVGLLSPIYALLGVDSAVHMSEEIRDAGIVLPRATMWAITINGSIGFVMMVTFCFTLGDPEAILETYTGYPFIQAFYNVTQSYTGASVMVAVLITTITSSCISTVATVSRQMWSFARDKALPFSSTIAHVHPGWNIPLTSVLLTWLITSLLSLINIGSSTAFNAIASSSVTALLTTYIISISCVVLRRLRGPALPSRRWSLGRYGLFINLAAILYLLFIWIFVLFPVSVPVTPATMNWNCLIFGGTTIFAVVYYHAYGKKQYTGPVALVRRNL